MRIEGWIKPQPIAVLQHHNIVSAIHDGGANYFFESITSGLPQVVLPAWIDYFDFANRAEMLGVRKRGNKSARPRCTAMELGPILVDVIIGPNHGMYTKRAMELSRGCGTDIGRHRAVRLILGEV